MSVARRYGMFVVKWMNFFSAFSEITFRNSKEDLLYIYCIFEMFMTSIYEKS